MMPAESPVLPAPIHGIVPPMVTPLLEDGRLDLAGLERLIDHLLAGGIHGLFILGTSGEAVSLPGATRGELITQTCRLVRRRLPVLAGITDTCLADSIALAKHAADAGADAVVLSAPYYLPPEQAELVACIREVVARQPLPVLLYNIPSLTKTAYSLDAVRELAAIERVIGMKDSGGELAYLRQVVAIGRPGWSVLQGFEPLFVEGIAAGATGCVGAGANVAPKRYVELHQAAAAGETGRVESLLRPVTAVRGLYGVGAGVPGVIRGIKCALSILGICGEHMAAPFRRATAEERRRVAERVAQLEWR